MNDDKFWYHLNDRPEPDNKRDILKQMERENEQKYQEERQEKERVSNYE